MLHLNSRAVGCALALAGLIAGASVDSAVAHKATDSSGGVEIPAAPTVRVLKCDDGRTAECAPGRVLTLRGESLHNVDEVLFGGARGKRDDQLAAIIKQRPHAAKVRVPAAAISGPVTAMASPTDGDAGSVQLDAPETSPTTSATADGFVFPIVGRYKIGREFVQSFGGGRNHKGHDVFASCGRPIVAALGGTVAKAAYQSAAGNYVVVDGDDGRSYVYMHMLETPVVEEGDAVSAGQRLGAVGETGRASGCHLHFELWTAPGWYKGGEAIDPLPELEAWAAAA